MKHATTSLVTHSRLALALALAIWLPMQARSAEPAREKGMMGAKEMKCCQEMKEQGQKMMAEIKAQDAELTALVADMNRASADKKVDLIAAIVTRMVEQRTAMNARMEKMHAGMMQHMPMCKEDAEHHPMMKDMDEKPMEPQGGQK